MGQRKQRVWKIRMLTNGGTETCLVRARSKADAVDYAIRKYVEIGEATFDDAAEIGASGGKIEESGAEPVNQ